MLVIALAKYLLLPSVFLLANIYSLLIVLCLCSCKDLLVVFCCSLTTVSSLFVVDVLKDCLVLSAAFGDYRKALGKGLVLKTL
jgi:hypothetical protein